MERVSVKVSDGGRIVIPADFRKVIGIDIGDELILHMEKDKMILLTQKQAIHYVQERMGHYSTNGRVLSEELICERQDELAHE